MSFGLAGSSGAGKTTLAKKLAETLQIPYYDASVTKLMGEIGFNPVGPGAPLDERLVAQEFLLDRTIERLAAQSRPFITDRTPIDFAAYMLGEVTMTNSTPEQGARIAAYVDRCVKAMGDHFEGFLILRPLPFYEASNTRPRPNAGYQRNIQYLIEGLAYSIRSSDMGILKPVDLGARLYHSANFFKKIMDEWIEEKQASSCH